MSPVSQCAPVSPTSKEGYCFLKTEDCYGRLLAFWTFYVCVEPVNIKDHASDDDFWQHYLNVQFSDCYEISDLTHWPTGVKP